MTQKIAIIDYESGNLKSVLKAFLHVGADAVVTRDKKVIQNAAKIVLPGVGAFGHCVENLKKFGLFDVIPAQISAGKPFLGICLGLQLLFDESEESPGVRGLGIISGRVKRFVFNARRTTHDAQLKVPHMGWNQIRICRTQSAVRRAQSHLFKNIDDGADFYFIHSYYVEPKDAGVIAATTDFGGEFCSAVQKNNIVACQFHPEKSQANGLMLIENFVKWKNV